MVLLTSWKDHWGFALQQTCVLMLLEALPCASAITIEGNCCLLSSSYTAASFFMLLFIFIHQRNMLIQLGKIPKWRIIGMLALYVIGFGRQQTFAAMVTERFLSFSMYLFRWLNNWASHTLPWNRLWDNLETDKCSQIHTQKYVDPRKGGKIVINFTSLFWREEDCLFSHRGYEIWEGKFDNIASKLMIG